jgi:hypothetical protein
MSHRKSLVGLILAVILLTCLYSTAESADRFGVRGLKKRGAPLQTATQLVRDAGIGWHRHAVLWKDVVDDEGNFDWQPLDNKIRKILNKKIKIVITLRSVHKIFAPDSGFVDLGYKGVWKSAPPAPEYLEYYNDFVRQAVERYDGDGLSDVYFVDDTKNIKLWQIEGEPGKKRDKGSNYWNGTAADYADHYLIACDVINEADPEAKVLLSGFTYAAVLYALDHDDSFLMKVLRILDERGGDFYVFDLHFYKDYRKFFRANRAIRFCLDTYPQFEGKPVWVTETNVYRPNLNPHYAEDEYNGFTAKDIVRRYAVLFGKNVEKVFWHEFSDKADDSWYVPMEPNDYWRFRGLTDRQLNPKPVYYTYKLLIDKITGKKRARRKSRSETNPDMFVYKFGQSDDAVFIAWYDSAEGEPLEAFIPLPWDQALITHVITEPGITEPETEVKSTVSGVLQITLDNSPIFIEQH